MHYKTCAELDLWYTRGSLTIYPSGTTKIVTSLRVAIPEGYEAFVIPRKGLGMKHHISLANTVDLIAPGYRGNVFVCLVNSGEDTVVIERYEPFAKLVVIKLNILDNKEHIDIELEKYL